MAKKINKIAIIEWEKGTQSFMLEPFLQLGLNPILYHPSESIIRDVDAIFSFGFFKNYYLLLNQLSTFPREYRPLYFHWNTEGVPDLRIPPIIAKMIAIIRSKIGRSGLLSNGKTSIPILGTKLNRFRYLGDYLYANKQKLLDYLFDSSLLYVDLEKKVGLPCRYIPWGTFRSDYKTLNIERDIDVLWMGKPRGKRRNNLVQLLKYELEKRQKKMVIIDGVENPYVFGKERTHLLNRSKIMLNLLPAWDAYNYIFKFHLAAGNRSIMISEPFQNHNTEYIAGHHYVKAPSHDLVDTLVFYSEHTNEREQIADNAFELVTTKMTMKNSIENILSTF